MGLPAVVVAGLELGGAGLLRDREAVAFDGRSSFIFVLTAVAGQVLWGDVVYRVEAAD